MGIPQLGNWSQFLERKFASHSLREVTHLKLCWSFLNSQDSWAAFLKCIVIRHNVSIVHHISSSLWSSIKSKYMIMMESYSRLICDGTNINFWKAKWCVQPDCEMLNFPLDSLRNLKASVSEFNVYSN